MLVVSVLVVPVLVAVPRTVVRGVDLQRWSVPTVGVPVAQVLVAVQGLPPWFAVAWSWWLVPGLPSVPVRRESQVLALVHVPEPRGRCHRVRTDSLLEVWMGQVCWPTAMPVAVTRLLVVASRE